MCIRDSTIATRHTQWHQVVRDIMTPHPATVFQDLSAEQALQTMVNLGFSVLPVERNGRIVGVVSKKALEKTSLMRLQQKPCLLYTSDAADEEDSVDLG